MSNGNYGGQFVIGKTNDLLIVAGNNQVPVKFNPQVPEGYTLVMVRAKTFDDEVDLSQEGNFGDPCIDMGWSTLGTADGNCRAGSVALGNSAWWTDSTDTLANGKFQIGVATMYTNTGATQCNQCSRSFDSSIVYGVKNITKACP
jgi:hypothetical protein